MTGNTNTSHGIPKPHMIFDGLVPVYSTCRDCGEIMRVTKLGDTVHPGCTPRPTRIEKWEQSWKQIAESMPYEKLPAHLKRKMDELEFKIDVAADEDRVTALHNAAMQYAQWGWPVFPLARNAKVPAIRKADGGKGVLDATNNLEWVCKWWSGHPEHNVGIATGFAFDVIDIDPDAGGVESFTHLLKVGRIPEVHAVVVSAGRDAGQGKGFRTSGLHLYVKPTGRGNYAGVMPGVDYRGRGGYVVGPSSTLGTRVRTWTWAVEPSPIIKAGNNNEQRQHRELERQPASDRADGPRDLGTTRDPGRAPRLRPEYPARRAKAC